MNYQVTDKTNRKKNGRLHMLIFILLVVALLPGCMAIRDEDILSAPKLSLKYEEVSRLIESNIEGNYELVNPLYGNNTASVQFVDLNNDKKDEIILFYRSLNDEFIIKAAVFSENEGIWNVDKHIMGIAYEINRVEFPDLNGDGKKEIVVGWQAGSIYKKAMSVYAFDGKEVTSLHDDIYTEMAVSDFTGDSIEDLILVRVNRVNGTATATLFGAKDKKMSLLAQTELDGFINGYYNLRAGLAKPGKAGLFLDARHGDHSSFTDLLVFDGMNLNNVFYDKKWRVTQVTYRNAIRNSQDMDGDKIVEIPVLIKPMGYESADPKSIPWVTLWGNWDGATGLVWNMESYQNQEAGYEWIIPKSYRDRYTITVDDSKGAVTFSLIDEEGAAVPILEIMTMKSDVYRKQADLLKANRYFELDATDEKVYIARLDMTYAEVADKLTEEDCIKNFKLVNTER